MENMEKNVVNMEVKRNILYTKEENSEVINEFKGKTSYER
jgi:hypothetical protein